MSISQKTELSCRIFRHCKRNVHLKGNVLVKDVHSATFFINLWWHSSFSAWGFRVFKLNPALSFRNVQTQSCKPFILLTILFNKLKTNISKNFLSWVKSGFTKMLYLILFRQSHPPPFAHHRNCKHLLIYAGKPYWQIWLSTWLSLVFWASAGCEASLWSLLFECRNSGYTKAATRIGIRTRSTREHMQRTHGVTVGVETLWSYAGRNWLSVRRQAGQSP